jgi:hypothetical protein
MTEATPGWSCYLRALDTRASGRKASFLANANQQTMQTGKHQVVTWHLKSPCSQYFQPSITQSKWWLWALWTAKLSKLQTSAGMSKSHNFLRIGFNPYHQHVNMSQRGHAKLFMSVGYSERPGCWEQYIHAGNLQGGAGEPCCCISLGSSGISTAPTVCYLDSQAHQQWGKNAATVQETPRLCLTYTDFTGLSSLHGLHNQCLVQQEPLRIATP